METSLIPIFRVYRLYDITRTKKHLKINKEIGMMPPKTELIQVEQGKVIIIMRISIIYLLTTTLTNHTNRFHPLATPTSC